MLSFTHNIFNNFLDDRCFLFISDKMGEVIFITKKPRIFSGAKKIK
jgi:hypothetical protein